jgi:hypothetical protein
MTILACTGTSLPPQPSPTPPRTTPPTGGAPAATPSPTSAPSPPGAISGKLGYPSEFIPPLTIYAIDAAAPTRYRVVHTPACPNPCAQPRYTLAGVVSGVYVVVAFLTENPRSDLSGAYTRYVTCGVLEDPSLASRCTDHTPIPIAVRAGATTGDVDLRDWYAPPGTFPARPTGGEPFAPGDRLTVHNPFADEINVRSEPSLGARLLGTVPNGAALTVADGPKPVDGYDWYFVRSDTLAGWAVGYALRR